MLNEYRFRQQARAIMEDQQMKTYSLFQKIGAFSINRNNPRKAIRSLRYAVKSFEREKSSLFIYPEGSITPTGSEMDFEDGLAWLHDNLNEVDFVPVGIYMHTIRHDKPELHLHVGRPTRINDDLPRDKKTIAFERILDQMLKELRNKAGFDDREFEWFL